MRARKLVVFTERCVASRFCMRCGCGLPLHALPADDAAQREARRVGVLVRAVSTGDERSNRAVDSFGVGRVHRLHRQVHRLWRIRKRGDRYGVVVDTCRPGKACVSAKTPGMPEHHPAE